MSTIKSKLLKTFCLAGLLLDDIENSENAVFLKVRSPRHFAKCPHCFLSTNKIHKSHSRLIKHMLCDNKLVYLKLKIKYFKCKYCFKIFSETIPGISSKSYSDHFQKSTVKKIRDRSFSSVAKESGISSSTLINQTKNIFNNFSVPWPSSKFALGIDEHSFSGRDLLITITDLTNHRLLAILHNDKQTTLKRFLHNIPENIKYLITSVCTDMKSSYRPVIESILPHSPLVIDKFHVIQHLNWHIQQFRSIFTSSKFPLPKQLLEKNKEDLIHSEKVKLKKIFKLIPQLEELWNIKEFLRRMYRCKNFNKANVLYQSLLNELATDERDRFKLLFRTLKKWKNPILNYFKHRVTNAFTEGCHTKIKLLKRISYGFRNKENYIAKMSLAFLPLATIFQLFSSPSLT